MMTRLTGDFALKRGPEKDQIRRTRPVRFHLGSGWKIEGFYEFLIKSNRITETEETVC